MTRILRAAGTIIGHKSVSLIIVGLFVVLASHIAFTRVFPLPYDEGYHFGLIQFYTHHLSPFLAGQPAGMDGYGAVARDPSYLYHYLMSFPFRLIQVFAHTITTQVIGLRCIDIVLGICTLSLVWKLARRMGLSRRAANLAMLLLAITPVFYDIAGQINYDNLLIPLTLLSLLLTWQVANKLKNGELPLAASGFLLALLLLTSLVKYSFLPIMVGLVAYLGFVLLKRRRILHLDSGFKRVPVAVSVVLLIVASGLWIQRYGVNLVTYHTPVPQCNTVLNVQECSAFGPWYRNYMLRQTYASHPIPTLELYGFTRMWVKTMYQGVYATVHISGSSTIFTTTQMLIDTMTGLIILAGVYALIRFRKFVSGSVPWALVLTVSGCYLLVLWGQNFSDFHRLGALVAVQGRYLLPLLPLAYIVFVRCYSLLASDLQPARLRALGAEYMIAALVGYRYIVQRMKSAGLLLRTP